MPSQCSALGASRAFIRSCFSGSYGATSGATSAISTTTASTAMPNGAPRAVNARLTSAQR